MLIIHLCSAALAYLATQIRVLSVCRSLMRVGRACLAKIFTPRPALFYDAVHKQCTREVDTGAAAEIKGRANIFADDCYSFCSLGSRRDKRMVSNSKQRTSSIQVVGVSCSTPVRVLLNQTRQPSWIVRPAMAGIVDSQLPCQVHHGAGSKAGRRRAGLDLKSAKCDVLRRSVSQACGRAPPAIDAAPKLRTANKRHCPVPVIV